MPRIIQMTGELLKQTKRITGLGLLYIGLRHKLDLSNISF